MKIKLSKLKQIIQEELNMLHETRPTFGLRVGDTVRHRDESGLGVGTVVSKMNKRERTILVRWDNGDTQRYDPSTLIKEAHLYREQ